MSIGSGDLESVAKVIDFRKVEEKCNLPKIEAFETYVIAVARPGEVYKVIMGDADTWYAFKNLAGELGYEVIDSAFHPPDTYILYIRLSIP